MLYSWQTTLRCQCQYFRQISGVYFLMLHFFSLIYSSRNTNFIPLWLMFFFAEYPTTQFLGCFDYYCWKENPESGERRSVLLQQTVAPGSSVSKGGPPEQFYWHSVTRRSCGLGPCRSIFSALARSVSIDPPVFVVLFTHNGEENPVGKFDESRICGQIEARKNGRGTAGFQWRRERSQHQVRAPVARQKGGAQEEERLPDQGPPVHSQIFQTAHFLFAL